MLASLAAASAVACASAASFAQEPPQAGAPQAAGAHDHWAKRGREHAEARARALHDILNIRPDQEAAFQTFVELMRPPQGAGGMREHHDTGDMDHLTMPERLDRMAARMAERQAAFQRRAVAAKAFYAVLSPEQRRAFDALPSLMGARRQGGEGRDGPSHVGRPHPEG